MVDRTMANRLSCQSMSKLTVDFLIDQGPAFVRDFIRQPHSPDEFAPEFSWLLLADVVAFEVGWAHDRADLARAAGWAEIASLLYEGLARGARPQDDLARDVWTRKAAHYRALAAGPTPPAGPTPEAREPHPI